MEWNELIKYIDAGALIIIIILFAKGLIISKYTMDKREKAFKETLNRICESHQKTIKLITVSFEKAIKEMKNIIKILKIKNGIK